MIRSTSGEDDDEEARSRGKSTEYEKKIEQRKDGQADRKRRIIKRTRERRVERRGAGQASTEKRRIKNEREPYIICSLFTP
jgi:FtsZ-interacting cell division protein YlmF